MRKRKIAIKLVTEGGMGPISSTTKKYFCYCILFPCFFLTYSALYDIRVMVKTIVHQTIQHLKKRCVYLLFLQLKMTYRIIRQISDGAEKKSRLSFDP
jgi:hypothetical protein